MPTFQTEYAASYIESSTDKAGIYQLMIRKGKGWLKRARIESYGDDLPFLVYRLWRLCGESWQHSGDGDDFCLCAGEISDQITEHEAELLCQIEPALAARVPHEGIGSMTPEVTAVHELLLEVAACMEDAWTEHEVLETARQEGE